jgi:hypothetical protein
MYRLRTHSCYSLNMPIWGDITQRACYECFGLSSLVKSCWRMAGTEYLEEQSDIHHIPGGNPNIRSRYCD